MLAKTILVVALAVLLASSPFAEAVARTAPKPLAQQGQIGDLRHVIWDVFVNGKYVGSDPDAIARNQLMIELDASK
jgi:hypothetical protein